MRALTGAVLATLTLGSIGACENSVTARTQLIASVDAEPGLKAQLRALQVLMYRSDDSDDQAPRRRHVIAFEEVPTQGLPLSFGITRERAERLRLAISGCADAGCTQLLVTSKLLVRFLPGESSYLSIVLLPSCSARVCAGLSATCEAGECVPVQEQVGAPVVPGEEPSPTIPLDTPSVPVADPPDANLSDCPPGNNCQSAIYPCVPTEGTGFTCLGQMADWPMPDSLSAGGARYTLRSEEITRDEVTHLDWQRKVPSTYAGCTGKSLELGDTCTQAEARAYCQQLVLDGRGWRLPSKVELESLLDFRKEVTTLDPHFFFTTKFDEPYWTTSPVTSPAQPRDGYAVSMLAGYGMTIDKDSRNPVRCVRSANEALAYYPQRYVDSEQWVGDVRTGLSWSKFVSCEKAPDDAGAESYCASLQGRVPTVKELLTLVDPTSPATERQPALSGTISRHIAVDSASFFLISNTPAKTSDERMVLHAKLGNALTMTLARSIAAGAATPLSYCVQCVR